jgi:hypothetical protein
VSRVSTATVADLPTATTLDARQVSVPHLAFALYVSDMPDQAARPVDAGALIGWVEQGLSRIDPARLSSATTAWFTPGDIALVYDALLPEGTAVRSSAGRRRTAVRLAWVLLAVLEGDPVLFHEATAGSAAGAINGPRVKLAGGSQ